MPVAQKIGNGHVTVLGALRPYNFRCYDFLPVSLPPRKKKKPLPPSDADDEDDNETVQMSFCIVETPAPPVLSSSQRRVARTKPMSSVAPLNGNLVDLIMRNVARSTDAVGLKVALDTLKGRLKDYNFSVFMPPPSPVKKELPWLMDEADQTGKVPLDSDTSLMSLLHREILYSLFANKWYVPYLLPTSTFWKSIPWDIKLRVWAVAMVFPPLLVLESSVSNASKDTAAAVLAEGEFAVICLALFGGAM
ncbi:hypothetical protein B0H14DRAFT_3488270 [Mycena olivaceomarginata]|nr:hypothetical protein B0H14DRAFT_3488270 [Mycena olivaceomarginata]